MIRRLDGTPVPGVAVQAFGFDRMGERSSSPLQTAVTDSMGNYVIQPLPSGQYVIGVNARPYDDDNPFPPTLYADGRPVYLGESASVVGIDLVVPAPRTPARLRIRAVTLDGKPCKRATVRLDTPAGVQRWFSLEATDERGEVVAPVYIGQPYTVRVFHYLGRRQWQGSATVEVTDLEQVVSVVVQDEREGRGATVRPSGSSSAL